MNKRDRTHIDRIKEELSFIGSAVRDLNKASFLVDEIIQHAILMALITIGECANHLSDDFKESHSEIEWIQIIAVRNIAAHGYWQLDMEQIWQAIEDDIPRLIEFFSNY